MIQLLKLLIILTFLTSCSESFKELNPKIFNDKIATRTDIKTPEELARLYYDHKNNDG